jgi:hypothetical protein
VKGLSAGFEAQRHGTRDQLPMLVAASMNDMC